MPVRAPVFALIFLVLIAVNRFAKDPDQDRNYYNCEDYQDYERYCRDCQREPLFRVLNLA